MYKIGILGLNPLYTGSGFYIWLQSILHIPAAKFYLHNYKLYWIHSVENEVTIAILITR